MQHTPEILIPQDFKKLITNGYGIVDCRDGHEFVAGYIPNSIFLGSVQEIERWAATILPPADPLLLVLPDTVDGKRNIDSFKKAGIPQIKGILKGGFSAWEKSGEPVDMLIEIDSDELALDIRFDDDLLVVDVREKDEYDHEHIRGAVAVPLSELGDVARIAVLDETANIYLHGNKVSESLLAASVLKKHGYDRVHVLSEPWESIRRNTKMGRTVKSKKS